MYGVLIADRLEFFIYAFPGRKRWRVGERRRERKERRKKKVSTSYGDDDDEKRDGLMHYYED